jgi:hypothetical protein
MRIDLITPQKHINDKVNEIKTHMHVAYTSNRSRSSSLFSFSVHVGNLSHEIV